MKDLEAYMQRLHEEDARVVAGGGPARRARQKRLGRWSVRERIERLLDPDSFMEIGRHRRHHLSDLDPTLAANRPVGDAFVCGLGSIQGQTVAVCAHDSTVLRGAMGSAAAQKYCAMMQEAVERKLPLVTLADSDGARIVEGVHAIEWISQAMGWTVRHREVAPHLTIVSGLCVGAAAYMAALSDFVVMVRQQSFMFLTGPTVTASVTGEDVDISLLGGDEVHASVTGLAHGVVDSEQEAVDWVRGLLAYTREPVAPSTDDPTRALPDLGRVIPTSPRRVYDVRKVLRRLVDEGALMEVSSAYAGSLLTAFARIGGRSVALLASQPMTRMGCLDIDSSRKGESFLRYAETHGLPVITLVDTSGYIPGRAQEHGGVLREGARLIRAYVNLSVPTLSVTLRKSYGGANLLASASSYRLALPTAEVAPMGAHAAAHVALGPVTPETAPNHERFMQTWRATHGDAWRAAERGFFDAVIDPSALRAHVWRVLQRRTS